MAIGNLGDQLHTTITVAAKLVALGAAALVAFNTFRAGGPISLFGTAKIAWAASFAFNTVFSERTITLLHSGGPLAWGQAAVASAVAALGLFAPFSSAPLFLAGATGWISGLSLHA
jgi:hypothetical protein